MPPFRQALRVTLKRLGKSGIDFLVTLAFYFLFYFTGHGILATLCFLALIPPAIILFIRGVRYVKQHSLWSVRNRLLFVYGLFGFVPLMLLFLLVVLSGWALMSELAIYLASSALDRHIEAVRNAADFLHGVPLALRPEAAEHLLDAHSQDFPGVMIYLKDQTGDHRFPPSSPPLQVPPGWKTTNGLLFHNSRFYAWAHIVENQDQRITLLAPLSDQAISNLVPHLGVIALVEPGDRNKRKPPIAAGGMHIDVNNTSKDQDLTFATEDNPDRSHSGRVPPPVNRFDIQVAWPSTRPHYHLDRPGETHPGVLWVQSRPSAVFRSFFSGSEILRGVLVDVLITIAVLFLLVELVALLIGISLSHRITTAVSQLYEGTRRVIYGDFRHRIPVRAHDQLGELAESFNQMTGNLERLMVIEKEKERLETELEIAREVQAQLYPKEEPPRGGLQVTARCDPARMVSGDYYDYQALVQGKMVFAIGDIAGKGISAALLMATMQAALRAQVSQSQPPRDVGDVSELDPATLVSKLNQQIYAHTSPEKYATFFFALYDESSRSLTYTNAGHLSPLLFRDGNVAPLDSNGTVVGAFPFSQYGESSLTFQPGDLLVCYTDGITEPENAYGEMFGEERLIDLVHRNLQHDAHEIIRIIFDAVRGWTGSPELHDDMTLLLARQVQPA
jgi:sigma-B regulation protein RsbU (phosphoserine phosphatase)